MNYVCPHCGQQHDTTACPPSGPIEILGDITPQYGAFVPDYTAVLNRIADQLERLANNVVMLR